jgi:hypothetical protein
MKKIQIEHIGIIMPRYNHERSLGIIMRDPIKIANWYREVLVFEIKFAAEDNKKAVAFITDANNR